MYIHILHECWGLNSGSDTCTLSTSLTESFHSLKKLLYNCAHKQTCTHTVCLHWVTLVLGAMGSGWQADCIPTLQQFSSWNLEQSLLPTVGLLGGVLKAVTNVWLSSLSQRIKSAFYVWCAASNEDLRPRGLNGYGWEL